MFAIMAGLDGLDSLRSAGWRLSQGAEMSLVPHVKAFKKRFHKSTNPVGVQLADEAVQRYFQDIMRSHSFTIEIGQCFSLVHRRTCRDSTEKNRAQFLLQAGCKFFICGNVTLFQGSRGTGEWRLGPAAAVHPSTQTAEHPSHPGGERSHPSSRNGSNGSVNRLLLDKWKYILQLVLGHIPRPPVSLQQPSFQYRTRHRFETRPEPSTALETTGAKQCQSPGTPTGPAAEECSGFAKGRLILVCSLFSSASLPRAPLWRPCVVDLRLLCCKCESFPKWALVCSIHGRWKDRCMFFSLFF